MTGPKILTVVVALAWLLCPGAGATRPPAPPRPPEETMIRYHVTLPERQAHRVHVRLELEGLSGDHVDLAMPVWTPGSYLVREYARHVIELTASAPDGRMLATSKPSKDTWRVDLAGASAVGVDYVLYANEVSVRTSHVTSDHAYLQPAATFLRHAPSVHGPHHVTVDAPAGWRVFTGLRADRGGFTAADYDVLIDSPLEVGPHTELDFSVRGVPHRVVFAGSCDVDLPALRDDMAVVCEEVASVFDLMPVDDYTFIVALVDEGGGGLEHANSSVNMFNRWSLGEEAGRRRFLSLIAHEYFHTWNAKRFRPEALGPFDYSQENYTPDLWVAEGFTSYYDDLTTLRAGFGGKADDYLGARASAFEAEALRPGSERMSLTRSSLDAWIKHYRPDENSRNVAVSYYSKGALVALMLDLRIRRLTGGDRTLADVLRLGWERYTANGVGYPPGAVAAMASEVAGADLSGFFGDYVEGVAPLAPDDDLAWVGLRLERKPTETPRALPVDELGRKLEPRLGVTIVDRGGQCVVDVVDEDGPAYRAGLNHDDEILAVDGFRATSATLQSRLDRRAGEAVQITFFRRQELRTLTVQPELHPLETWAIVSVDEPTAAQRDAFRTWTTLPHPADGAGGESTVADDAGAETAGAR